MEHLEFIAENVSITTENGARIVGLADSKNQPTQYVILQRGLVDDEQEIKLGLNTYHFEIGSQALSGYGGLETVTLSARNLVVDIRQPNQRLGDLKRLTARFQIPKDKWDLLHQTLRLIFDDSDCALTVKSERL